MSFVVDDVPDMPFVVADVLLSSLFYYVPDMSSVVADVGGNSVLVEVHVFLDAVVADVGGDSVLFEAHVFLDPVAAAAAIVANAATQGVDPVALLTGYVVRRPVVAPDIADTDVVVLTFSRLALGVALQPAFPSADCCLVSAVLLVFLYSSPPVSTAHKVTGCLVGVPWHLQNAASWWPESSQQFSPH